MVQSSRIYQNRKEKLMDDPLDKSSDDLFKKRLTQLMRDEKFKEQYERLFRDNEFIQFLSGMVNDHEKCKDIDVSIGSNFMNNASSDWAEAVRKLSCYDKKDASRKFSHSNRDESARRFSKLDESSSLKNFDKDGHHYDDKSTNYDSSMESLFPERRDFHGDYEDTISTDTYSQKGGYADTHYYNSGGDLYHVMYKNNGHGQTKAKAKTGVHLPMFDEYPTEKNKYYNNSKNGRRINSVKQKIYRNMPFIRKFFNKIDAKLESEMRRYLDIKEAEKHNYSVRKLKGTEKLFYFLSKYRGFAPLVVVGMISSILIVLIVMEQFSGTFTLKSLFPVLSASVGPFAYAVLVVISYALPFILVSLAFCIYDLLVLYYARKLNKIKCLRKNIKNLIAMRNKDDE
eukprot:XP_002258800.1 hypothetical protein, conserved in Plasmodium species [Plasmodium knowlesi strain H]